jgi:hypothetical protein
MIRWYDYVAAILMADFIFAWAMTAAFSEVFWMQILAAMAVTFLYDIWANVYCRFRLKMEMKND